MKRMLISCTCLLAVAAIARPSVLAPPTKPDKLQAAVEHLMTRLLTDEKDLYLGMEIKEAEKALAGAADLGGLYHLSLADSKLAPKGNWSGVITGLMDSEEGTALESLGVALLCDKYDKGKMGQFLVEAGRNQEVGIEQDESDSNYYISVDGPRNLTIALGDTVIALVVDLPE